MDLNLTNRFEDTSRVIGSIVTSNYIPQAMATFGYLKESNPHLPYLVLIIGERADIESDLPKGPHWMFWDELLDVTARDRLARSRSIDTSFVEANSAKSDCAPGEQLAGARSLQWWCCSHAAF